MVDSEEQAEGAEKTARRDRAYWERQRLLLEQQYAADMEETLGKVRRLVIGRLREEAREQFGE